MLCQIEVEEVVIFVSLNPVSGVSNYGATGLNLADQKGAASPLVDEAVAIKPD
jgi:hypothetical protein